MAISIVEMDRKAAPTPIADLGVHEATYSRQWAGVTAQGDAQSRPVIKSVEHDTKSGPSKVGAGGAGRLFRTLGVEGFSKLHPHGRIDRGS